MAKGMSSTATELPAKKKEKYHTNKNHLFLCKFFKKIFEDISEKIVDKELIGF